MDAEAWGVTSLASRPSTAWNRNEWTFLDTGGWAEFASVVELVILHHPEEIRELAEIQGSARATGERLKKVQRAIATMLITNATAVWDEDDEKERFQICSTCDKYVRRSLDIYKSGYSAENDPLAGPAVAIRAVQGHSVDFVIPGRAGKVLEPSDSKELRCIVHGTQSHRINSILTSGLLPGGVSGVTGGSRNCCFFAAFPADDHRCKSGMRKGGRGDTDAFVYFKPAALLSRHDVVLTCTGALLTTTAVEPDLIDVVTVSRFGEEVVVYDSYLADKIPWKAVRDEVHGEKEHFFP